MPTIEEFNDIIFYEYWFITFPICFIVNYNSYSTRVFKKKEIQRRRCFIR